MDSAVTGGQQRTYCRDFSSHGEPIWYLCVMTRNAHRLCSAAVVAAFVLLGGGCGDDDQTSVDASESAAPATEGGSGNEADDDVQTFCRAVEALARTDGTTDSATVLAAFEDLRTTAPSDIRQDVMLISDHMLVSDFPDAAASMEQASYEQRKAASGRFAAYVEEHC